MILKVRVVASDPAPDRFRWEIYRPSDQSPIERAAVSFRVENSALQAGKRALAQFLRNRGQTETGSSP